MKKMNSKGFTLIELLAVIVIMGILMMVAIPAMTRYIENARKDTFMDTAKQYVNSVRNLWASDSIVCGTDNTIATALPAGTYYVPIDSSKAENDQILESGGKSSWSNADVKGFVKMVVTTDATTNKNTTKYYVSLADKNGHGINNHTTIADKLVRADVKTRGAAQQATPGGSAVSCKVN